MKHCRGRGSFPSCCRPVAPAAPPLGSGEEEENRRGRKAPSLNSSRHSLEGTQHSRVSTGLFVPWHRGFLQGSSLQKASKAAARWERCALPHTPPTSPLCVFLVRAAPRFSIAQRGKGSLGTTHLAPATYTQALPAAGPPRGFAPCPLGAGMAEPPGTAAGSSLRATRAPGQAGTVQGSQDLTWEQWPALSPEGRTQLGWKASAELKHPPSPRA